MAICVCSIFANLSFAESLAEEILRYPNLPKIIERVSNINSKKEVLKIVANISTSKQFQPHFLNNKFMKVLMATLKNPETIVLPKKREIKEEAADPE